jgi:hypothetical protein
MTPGVARGVLAAAVTAALMLVPWAAAAVPDEGVLETGVWWEPQLSDGALSPPGTELPPGALWLQSSPRGASAVSALRLSAPPGKRAQALVLKVRQDRSVPHLAALDLCPPQQPWKPPAAAPGAWAARALPDCGTTRISGVRGDDGTTLTFDVTALADSPVLDLVLTQPEGAVSAVDVVLEPLTRSALVVQQAEGVAATAPPPPGASGAQPPPSAPPGDAEAGFPPLTPGAGGIEAPAELPPLPAVPDEAGPVPEVAVDEPSGSGELAPAAAASPAGAGPAGDTARRAATAVLGVLLLWLVALLQRLSVSGSLRTGPVYTLYRGAPPRSLRH